LESIRLDYKVSVVGKYDGMGKYMVILMAFLGLSAAALAQNENLQTPQEMDENDMVCFLTDANTITCFVAPEEMPEEGLAEENTDTDNNQQGDEKAPKEKEGEKKSKEPVDSQKKKIKDSPSEIQIIEPDNRKDNGYNKTDVKMI